MIVYRSLPQGTTIADFARRRICGWLSQFGTIAPSRPCRAIQLTPSKQAIFTSVTLVAYLPWSPGVGSLSRRTVTITVALMWGGGVIAAIFRRRPRSDPDGRVRGVDAGRERSVRRVL